MFKLKEETAMTIYGPYDEILPEILSLTTERIKQLNQQAVYNKQPKLYEHLIARVKTHLKV